MVKLLIEEVGYNPIICCCSLFKMASLKRRLKIHEDTESIPRYARIGRNYYHLLLRVYYILSEQRLNSGLYAVLCLAACQKTTKMKRRCMGQLVVQSIQQSFLGTVYSIMVQVKINIHCLPRICQSLTLYCTD